MQCLCTLSLHTLFDSTISVIYVFIQTVSHIFWTLPIPNHSDKRIYKQNFRNQHNKYKPWTNITCRCLPVVVLIFSKRVRVRNTCTQYHAKMWLKFYSVSIYCKCVKAGVIHTTWQSIHQLVWFLLISNTNKQHTQIVSTMDHTAETQWINVAWISVVMDDISSLYHVDGLWH